MKVTMDRYFLAIIPPEEIAARARLWQEELSVRFGTKAALRSPPHITLHMPFMWKQTREDDLIESLQSHFRTEIEFLLSMRNVGAFPPRVIFVDVEATVDLVSCQARLTKYCRHALNLHNANYGDHPYHPHMTLAFRDLKKALFAKAWEELRDRRFETEFKVREISLLKHTGTQWVAYKGFTLKG